MATGNERNAHGKYLEDLLASCSNGRLELETCETAPDDGYLYCKPIGARIPVSVKNKGERGELCMGSFNNIIEHQGDVLLIYGLHEPYMAHPYVLYALYLPKGYYSLYEYTGDAEMYYDVADFVMDFEKYLSTTEEINEYKYDKEWCRQRKERRDWYFSLFPDTARRNVVIQPRPKRDHKSQHRLQCAISRRILEDITKEFGVAKYECPPESHIADPDAWRVFFDTIINGIIDERENGNGPHLTVDDAWEDRKENDPGIRDLISDENEDVAWDQVVADYDSVPQNMFEVVVNPSDFALLGIEDADDSDREFDEFMKENDTTYDTILAHETYKDEYYEELEEYYDQLEEYSEEDYNEDDVSPYGDDYYDSTGYDAQNGYRYWT